MLVGDIAKAQARLQESDTQTDRRALVRAIFAAIEGLHWRLKKNVMEHSTGLLTFHEHAALAEEAYSVDQKGHVSSIPRFLPLVTSIRLVVNIVSRYRPTRRALMESFQR
jgi:hypothetical protein